MRYLKYVALIGLFVVMAGTAHAQVAVQVGPVFVGPAPVCAYGYYGFAPYACAPYGYYGPSYFSGGVFIGAGPWFHGFYGNGWHGGPVFHGGPGFRGPAPRGFEGGSRGNPGFHGVAPRGGGDFHGGGGAVRGGGGGFHGGGRR
jgi:hypothetical protein